MLTALVHYVPYELRRAGTVMRAMRAESAREQLLESLLQQLEAYAPGIRDLIIASEVVVPEDFEASHGMTGGNWHHGELSIDQALMMRPFPGRLNTPEVLKGFISVVRDRIREEVLWVLRGKTPREKYSSRGSCHERC